MFYIPTFAIFSACRISCVKPSTKALFNVFIFGLSMIKLSNLWSGK